MMSSYVDVKTNVNYGYNPNSISNVLVHFSSLCLKYLFQRYPCFLDEDIVVSIAIL